MISLFKVHMPAAVDKPLLDVLHSGYIGQGAKVVEFEQKLGARLGTRDGDNVLSLNSGTAALTLALRLANVEGGEVISTPMTCTATNEPILDNRATPVWADVDPRTGLIDFADVEHKITARTKAIVVVDWGGLPCQRDEMLRIQSRYGIPVIEDAAHALGASYSQGQPVGGVNSPRFVCFSFQAIKHITTIDGGALVCQDLDDVKRGRLLRWYGIDREGARKDLRCEEDIQEWGYKMHMNDVNATIGIVQLDYLDGIIKAQRANARHYFTHIDHEAFMMRFSQPALDLAAFWLFTILCRDEADREDFRLYLEKCGIMASRVHVRNDYHSVFAPYSRNLPGVDFFADREIAIPVHWGLTEEERAHIVGAVNAYRTARRTIQV